MTNSEHKPSNGKPAGNRGNQGGYRGNAGGSFKGRKGEGRGGNDRRGGFCGKGGYRSEGGNGERRGSGKPYKGRKFDGQRDGGPRKFDGERKFNGDRKGGFDRDGKRSFDKPYGKRDFDGGRNGKPQGGRKFDGPRDGKPRKFDGDRKFDKPRGDRKFDKPRDRGGFNGSRKNDSYGKRDFKPRGERSFDDSRNQAPERERKGFAGFNGAGGPKPQGGKSSMPRTRVTPARKIALAVTRKVREEGLYVHDVFESEVAKAEEEYRVRPEEKAFARLLSLGVVSMAGSLDALIDSVLLSDDNVEDDVRDSLRVSAYEIMFLDKEAFAAVDQGVELVRSFNPRAKGLANFVLRRLVEKKEGDYPFGDVDADDGAFALQMGFPQWMVQRIFEDLGREAGMSLIKRSNDPAPLFFTVNLSKADGAETLGTLVSRGLKIVPVKNVYDERNTVPVFAFTERNAVADAEVSSMLKAGIIIISDVAAQGIASLAVPSERPGKFLEIGSGRGTKTILLQNCAIARFGQQMPLECLDVNGLKMREHTHRVNSARIRVDARHTLDASDLSSFEQGSFDAVFIDAPCSGVGTLRRHPEIRWSLQPEGITELARLNTAILEEAARLVAPDGRLTYATCTVFAEENEEVISRFLDSEAGKNFKVIRQFATGTSAEVEALGIAPDSHFVCILQRQA